MSNERKSLHVDMDAFFASVESLESWFRSYGELRGARRLARAIASAREYVF